MLRENRSAAKRFVRICGRAPSAKDASLTRRFGKAIFFCSSFALAIVAASGAGDAAPAGQTRGQKVASTGPDAKAAPSAADLAGSVVHHGDGVAAVVNDSVISDYDLRQRMALFIATSGVRPNENSLNEIRQQILKQLETERLQLLEAQKNNISVSAIDVDKAIDDIVKGNHLSMDQLKNVLSQGGVDMATLRAQISTQIAWSKLVQDQLGDRVHVSPEDVDAELARIKQGANRPRYLVAEIFQAVDSPEQDAKVLKDMTDVDTQIGSGAPFSAVARQFSQNPTAAQGGDLGWVQEGQLPAELDQKIKTMSVGDVTPPIRATGGYYILQLRDKQEPAGTKLPIVQAAADTPAGTLPLQRILLPIGPKPAKDLVERGMQAAAMIRGHVRGCERLHDLVSKVPGTMLMNLGTMRVADLSSEMQDALKKTEPGGVTEPMVSAAGIELLVRCDKAVQQETAIVIPTRDQVEQQLYEEQITVLARRYLRDLRREADVETR
jgi:peptidyl-prolyl cis-trans isomerase SurA